ncbi:MAG: sugar ABC transporter permease, partial [Caldilineaceae bacterium]|nr:sugar ABC transporter permease [Caldilineaceae bacterium]
MQSVSTSISRLAGARRTTQARVRREQVVTIVLFLLPAAILYSLLVIYPVFQAAHNGFYKWNGLGPMTNFVGLDNYVRILGDDIFHKAVWHNLVFIILSLVTQLPLALFCAILVG